MASVLYVDDEPPNLSLFRRWFDDDLTVLTAASGSEAIEILEHRDVGVVVSDQRMPGMTGIELLASVAKQWPSVTRILLTAYSDRDLMLSAIQRGQVHDYVLKPWDAKDLGLRLRRALDLHESQRALETARVERDALRREVDGQRPPQMIGFDGDLAPLVQVIDRIAPTDATVMIRGESGSGKELVARELHRRSARAERPFVRINCSAFAEGLLESELFGHEAGAFTGARAVRIGRFEQANRGTLFLDEIGDISPSLQIKLLRVIQEREIERVGGNKTIRVDIRLIAATHKNLEDLVKRGQLREDLFFRLNVVPIRVPPLRARPRDLALLARYFVTHFGAEMGKRLTLSPAAVATLERYDWPGNVRELRNLVERAAAMADPVAELGPDDFTLDFPPERSGEATSGVTATPATSSVFDEIARDEAEGIREALRKATGSKAGAARLLGIPRTTLNDRIERLGIR
jgi:DNA-binding NtrC family response regulator